MSKHPLHTALTLLVLGFASWIALPATTAEPVPRPGSAFAVTAASPATWHTDERGSPAPDDQPPVSFRAGLSHGSLLAHAAGEVFLCLELTGGALSSAPRPALNLALVIDRSGSMASERKLEHARSAADQLVARLRPDDRLALVAYDDEVTRAVPSTPASARERFHAAIAALEPGGSTDLHGGLVAGFQEVVAHHDPARLNRVLLISDGLANHGVTDPRAIFERAEGCRARGVVLATMGVGLDYDEDLLAGIAARSGGPYHYVDEPEGIGTYLTQLLDAMGRVVASNLLVDVRLAPGVEVTDVYGLHAVREGDTLSLPVPDLLAGERRRLVLRLVTPASAPGPLSVGAVTLRYDDAASGARHQLGAPPLRARATLLAAEVAAQRDLAVLTRVEVVRAATALDEAMELQKLGQVDAARALLLARLASGRAVNQAEYHSDDVSRILARLEQVADDLLATRGDRAAGRDLQLGTQLQALGYLGDTR